MKLARFPTAFGHWLNAADFAFASEEQLAILYPPASSPDDLLGTANLRFLPNLGDRTLRISRRRRRPPVAVKPPSARWNAHGLSLSSL